MRILYGVVGEGMGHAMRSRVVLEHLFAQGHEVAIVASGRAVDFLSKHFKSRGEVNRIHGFHIVYDENRVKLGKTIWSNVLAGTAAIPSQIAAYFSLIDDFKPEVVISDFESWSYFYAKAHRIPVLSVDNMQILNRATLDERVIQEDRADFELAKAFVKTKLPFADHYVVTTFFFPPVRKEKTTLVPPLLRPEIIAAKRRSGEHLLVYQTAEGNDALATALAKTGLECRIYGMRRQITSEVVEGNLRYRPFSEAGFIDDLASARAVIAGGGFTLLSEAVYLHKPVLSVPVEGQFEQVLNGKYIEASGYGRFARSLDDPRHIERFVAAIPECERALASYEQDGNTTALHAIDGFLDQAAGGIFG